MRPLIELAHVDVRLQGAVVLADISWSLEAGTHWAFTGANGSGKSTLLRTIAGAQAIERERGTRTYSHDGVHAQTALAAAAWIRHVAPEQQERYARLDLPLHGRTMIASGFDDSVYLQRRLTPEEAARVDALAARLRLGDLVARPVRELSSGQLRRLLIARALVRDPRVLVLDEVTNGLDRTARRELLALLETLAPHVQLVLASHRSSDFGAAVTHHAALRAGRIVERGLGPPVSRGRATAAHGDALADAAPGDVLIDIRHADVYRADARVLRDCTWSIRRGEHTAVHGDNGSGKSTFAQLVAGTLPAAFGAHVERFGSSGPFDRFGLAARIAHVSDDVQTSYDVDMHVDAVVASGFAGSIGLLTPPTAEQRDAVQAVLRRLGLVPLARRRFGRLSFGERRKVLIARSLVRPPDLFILDEVWNGLDAEFRAALDELLRELAARGTTLLLIAHHHDDLPPLVRRTFTIDGGRLRSDASRDRGAP